MSDLDDVRQLVNKLYAALNIGEHQLAKEREIIQEIEDIRHQLIPLEKVMLLLFSFISLLYSLFFNLFTDW